MATDGGGIETGVDAGEEDDEIFRDEILNALIFRGKELFFGRFPRGDRGPFHGAAPFGRSAVER